MPCVMVHTNAVYGNGTAVRQCHETMAQYSLTPGNCTDVPNSGVLDEGGAWPQWIMLQCTIPIESRSTLPSCRYEEARV